MYSKSWIYLLVFFLAFLTGGGGVNLVQLFKRPPVVVVFAADERYVPYLGVTLTSLVSHVSTNRPYEIFILSDDISEQNKEKLATVKGNLSNVKITFIDVDKEVYRIKSLKFPTNTNFSEATYFRFFIPEILKKYDKVLYLDADLIITSDIAPLFDIDLKDAVLGAAIQTPGADKQYAYLRGGYMKRLMQIDNPSLYFNAGVLLINVAQARRDSFTEKLLDKMKQLKNPPLFDQDVLNAVYAKDSVKFSYLYNFEPQFAEPSEQLPSIIHFSGRKPWKLSWPGKNRKSEYFTLFWTYAEQSPFKDKLWADADEKFCIYGIRFSHPYWTGMMKRLANNRMVRCANNDMATIIDENENSIRIKWDKWGEETFEKQSDGVYQFKKK